VAAGIDEAHKLGIRAVGHLSKTTWTNAAENQIDGLLHSGQYGPLLELISSEQRQKFANTMSLSLAEFDERPHTLSQLLKLVGEPYETAGQRLYDSIDLNGPEVEKLIKVLIKNKVLIDPTIVTVQSVLFGDEVAKISSLLEVNKTPKPIADFLWGEGWETKHRFWSDENKSYYTSIKPLFKLAKKLTLKLFNNGIAIGAGTDVGMPWMTPGSSLHRELELLVEAGITTSDVIKIATNSGSKFVYNEENVGTIEVGKYADMVILTANPLDNISNTRSIVRVIKSGVIYNPDTIFKELQEKASHIVVPALDEHH